MNYTIPIFFSEKLNLNSDFWEQLSVYPPDQIRDFFDIIFPNVANDKQRIERAFFFDQQKKVSDEYIEEHKNWPDKTFILDPPQNQKRGIDVIPGIKDVEHLIMKHQFPMSCSNKKFIAAPPGASGFGSIIHTIGAYLGRAIIEDKIFIWGYNNQIFNDGPLCGGPNNTMNNLFFSTMLNRSHTKIIRNQSYYTEEDRPEGFDCFFEKITNCSFKDISNLDDVFYIQLTDNHIVPEIIKPIIERLKIPEELSYYYWRLCATAFLYRENKLAKKLVKEAEEDFLVNPVDNYDISIHVRHGMKSSEMKLVYGEDITGAIRVIEKLLNKKKLNIFLSTEDPKVI